MSYKEKIETTITYPELEEEEKQYLKDNNRSSELDRCFYIEEEIEYLEEVKHKWVRCTKISMKS